MRTIGIDLAISASHQAVILDERGKPIGSPFRFGTDPADLGRLMQRAQAGAADDEPLCVVMEPTGSIWLPVASYFSQRGVIVYLVNTRAVSDLRKYYRKHARSDRISARVLARMPWVDPDSLHPLYLAGADYLSGQRWCRQQEKLADLMTAIRNRVQAWERAFWPGLEEVVGDLFAPWVHRWREAYYDPWRLKAVDTAALVGFLGDAGAKPEEVENLAEGLQAVARRAVALFGTPQGGQSLYVDYAALQDQVLRELRLLACYQAEQKAIESLLRPLYRQLHPSRNLETIQGVGKGGAAVYVFFAHHVERFASQKAFRGWSGMVPQSDQSGAVQKKGLRISGAGPDLVKKYAYINSEVARQWDPQIAAIYHEQMVHRGKHHVQAVCCCATHLLDRVRAVLRDDRAYQLRDIDGRPITKAEGRAIVIERYQVPEEVRKRNSQRARKARRDQHAERKTRKRRSHPAIQEADTAASPHTGLTSPPLGTSSLYPIHNLLSTQQDTGHA